MLPQFLKHLRRLSPRPNIKFKQQTQADKGVLQATHDSNEREGMYQTTIQARAKVYFLLLANTPKTPVSAKRITRSGR
jgi:hypothetical protein